MISTFDTCSYIYVLVIHYFDLSPFSIYGKFNCKTEAVLLLEMVLRIGYSV